MCDAERQADLEPLGERVVRTTRDQALAQPQQLVARLTAAGAPCAADSNPGDREPSRGEAETETVRVM